MCLLRVRRSIPFSPDSSQATHRRVIPSVTPVSAATTGPATHWGRFSLMRELGRGSHGQVFLARDPEGEEVALKLLHSRDPWSLEGFKNEARYLADLAHPALVAPSELVSRDGTLALVMPFVDGRPFTVALAEAAGPPEAGALADEPRVRRLVLGLFEAVAALHERGLVHLDLKPENVLVDRDDRVALLDFGLARLRAAATRPGEISGSYLWMAPEQLQLDTITPAVDLYSAGLLVFAGLAGAPAWDPSAGPHARLVLPPRELSALRGGLPDPYLELVRSLLEPTAARRPTAAALARSLAPIDVEPAPAIRVPPPFTGRVAELAHLDALLADARAGVPAIVRVYGRAGVGKSALIDRFAANASTGGASVVHGRCFAAESIPYKALDAALDQLADLARADPGATRLLTDSSDLSSLARVFPIFRTVVAAAPDSADAASDDDFLRARSLLRELVRHLASKQPLLVIVDDVHWGDADAVDLLMALVEPPDPPRVLVVLGHRDGEAWSSSPFAIAFEQRLQKGVPFSLAEVEVAPLTPADARALAASALGRDDAEVASIVEAAAGNALVLTRLLASPAASERDLTTLTERTLARLPGDLRRFVRTVALGGRALPIVCAARAAGVPKPTRASLAELVADGLIRTAHLSTRADAGRFVMPSHDLVREALVASLDADTRRAAHRALAEVLAATPALHDDLGLVAHHYAEAGDLAESARWALRAAEVAERTSAFARAADLLRVALAHGTLAPDDRRPLEVRLARAFREAGHGREAARIYQDLARSAADPAERRIRLRAGADALMTIGLIEEGLELLGPILTELRMQRSDAGAARGLRLVRGALAILLRLRRGVAASQPDPVAAERFDTSWSIAKSLVFVDPMAGLDHMLTALTHGEASGDPRRVARVTGPLAAFVLGTIGPFRPVARRWIAASEALAGDRYFDATAALWRGVMLCAEGHLAQAMPFAHHAIDSIAGVPEAQWERFQALSLMALLCHNRGHFTTAAGLVRTHLPDAERRGDLHAQVVLSNYLMWPTLAAGRPDETRAIADWTLRSWLPGRYSPQTFYALRAQGMIDLFEGRAAHAARALASGRAAFKKAGGYRIIFSRFDHDLFEARVALATEEPHGLLPIEKLLARLRAIPIPEGPAQASLLSASVAMKKGDRAAALAALEQAATALEAVGVDLDSQVARLRAAQLRGEASVVDSARRVIRQLGVADPDRWAQLVAPGYEALLGKR